jgi:hypothetical protein
MTIRTLVRFLFGDRDAILKISNSRFTLLLGLLFVLSAGFAREYDGEDLWHEPWHLLIPLGASLVSSFILYCLVEGIAYCRSKNNSFWSGYRLFLSLFWMTAPLAWLYAIPVERFLSAPDSVRANLLLLGIVSVWRVALITRVISVLYHCHWFRVFFVVMLFGDALMWCAISMMPVPVLSLMGGIRLTESEEVLLGVTFMLGLVGFLSAPIWLIGTLCACFIRPRDPTTWEHVLSESDTDSSVAKPLWVLSFAALLGWAVILPLTQPQQNNRHTVESLLRRGQISDSLTFMSKRKRADFPPHWDPPPRIGYGEDTPDIWEVMAATNDINVAPWVRSIYIEKILTQARSPSYLMHRTVDLREMAQEDLNSYIELLQEVGSGQKIAEYHTKEIDSIFYAAEDAQFSEPISDERRASLEKILLLAESSEATESPAPVPADGQAEPSSP